MRGFFDSEERQEQLRKELNEWLGTPFRHLCGVKGKGADCIHFAVQVYLNLGAISLHGRKITPYARDWHVHNCGELLLQGITGLGGSQFQEVDKAHPKNGDLLTFFYGRATSHAAIYCDEKLYQAITGVGVQRVYWKDKMWFKRYTHCFRVVT